MAVRKTPPAIGIAVLAAFVLVAEGVSLPALGDTVSGNGRYQSTAGVGQFGNNSSTILEWDRTGDDFFGFDYDTQRRRAGGVSRSRWTGSWGADVVYDISGRAGVEMGLTVDGGTIEVDLPFNFNVNYASSSAIETNPFAWTSLDSSFTATSAASLQTSTPSVSAFADFVFDFDAYVHARGCAGWCVGDTLIDTGVTRTKELVGINRDGDGQVRIGEVLGGGSYTLGDPIDIGSFGELTVDNINLTVSDGTPDSQSGLSGNALQQVARLDFDIDSIVGTFASSAFGFPYSGGGELDIDLGIFDANVLLLDYDITPYLGLEQQVDVAPNALMQMSFSRPMEVKVNGSSSGARNRVTFTPGVDDVEFKFPGREVDVTGRVILLPEVTNQLDLVGGVDHRLRAIGASVGIDGVGDVGFGPLVDETGALISPTTLVDLYDTTYDLRGGMTDEATFSFTFGEGINLPGNRDNPIVSSASFLERTANIQRFKANLGDGGSLSGNAGLGNGHAYFDENIPITSAGGCRGLLPNAPQGGRVTTGNVGGSNSAANRVSTHPASGCFRLSLADTGVGPGLSGLTGSPANDSPMFFEVGLRDTGLLAVGDPPQYATDLTFSIEEFLDGNANDMEFNSFEQLVIDNVVGDGFYDLWARNPVTDLMELVQADLGVGEVFNFTDYAARANGLDIYRSTTGDQISQGWAGLFGVTEFMIKDIDYDFGDFLLEDPSLVAGMTFTDRTQFTNDGDLAVLNPENTDFLVTMGNGVTRTDDPLGAIAGLGPGHILSSALPGVFDALNARCVDDDCSSNDGTGLDDPAGTDDDTQPPPVPEGSDPGLPFQPTLSSGNEFVFQGLALETTNVPMFDLLFQASNTLADGTTSCAAGLPGFSNGQNVGTGVVGGNWYRSIDVNGHGVSADPCFDVLDRSTPELLGFGDAWAFFEIPVLGNRMELFFDADLVDGIFIPVGGGSNWAFDNQFLTRYALFDDLALTVGGTPQLANFSGPRLSDWSLLGFNVPFLFGNPTDQIAFDLLNGPFDGSATMVIGLRFAGAGITGFTARSTSVPEPETLGLLVAGLFGLGAMRRRRWKGRG